MGSVQFLVVLILNLLYGEEVTMDGDLMLFVKRDREDKKTLGTF